MYDKYDSPGGYDDDALYDKSPVDQAQEAAGPIIEILKQNKKIIIGAIIALIVLFFVYDFFIGSSRDVSLNIVDTEGEGISANIKLMNTNGEEIKRLKSGDSISLKIGEYKADILAKGYKSIKSGIITVSQNGPIKKVLEIDKDFEISGTLPTEFVTGQETEIIITLQNNEPTEEKVEFVLEEDAEKVMTLNYDSPATVAPGENQITAKLIVNSKVDSKAVDKGQKITIRIKGLDSKNTKISGEYELTEFTEKDFKIKDDLRNKADFGNVKPGEVIEKTIGFENEGDFDINDVLIEVDNITTETADKDEVKSWFSYVPANTIDVPAGAERETKIRLQVPSTFTFDIGKTNEVISGIVKISTTFFKIERELTFEIQKPDSGIEIRGIKNNYEIKRAVGPDETGTLTIRNSGDVLLQNVDAKIVCTSQVSDWLAFNSTENEAIIGDIAKGDSKNVVFTIDIPEGVDVADSATCSIGISYREQNNQEATEQIKIFIVVKE